MKSYVATFILAGKEFHPETLMMAIIGAKTLLESMEQGGLPLLFRVDGLCKQFSGFDRFLFCLRERELWVGAESHVDTILRYRMTVVEVP